MSGVHGSPGRLIRAMEANAATRLSRGLLVQGLLELAVVVMLKVFQVLLDQVQPKRAQLEILRNNGVSLLHSN